MIIYIGLGVDQLRDNFVCKCLLTVLCTHYVSAPDPAQKTISCTRDKTSVKEEIGDNIFKDDTCGTPFSSLLDGAHITSISSDAVWDLVKRRLHATSALHKDFEEAQQTFGDIILSEVKVFWESFPAAVCTASFTRSEKEHLYRRLVTHILLVSEQLLLHYLQKMEMNKPHLFFSEEANLIRFKAQLLLDCSKFLNVFSVRHHLISEINQLKVQDKEVVMTKQNNLLEDIASRHPEQKHERTVNFTSSYSPFTMKYFLKLGRPKCVVPKTRREIDLMQIENIQKLNVKEAYELIPKQDYTKHVQDMKCEVITTPCPHTLSEDQEMKESNKQSSCLKKSHSCLELKKGDLLSTELGITIKPRAAECPEFSNTWKTNTVKENQVSRDLKGLIHNSTPIKLEPFSGDEIPPLIKAVTSRRMNVEKIRKMESLIKDLNKKHEQVKKPLKAQALLHPQPHSIDVVDLTNKPILRRADAQPSHRIFTELTQLSPYPPVYNDFSSEIESSTVKRLDQGLSVGSELEEVYGELINNLSTDHLKFDQDLLTEPYAVKMDFSLCLSSTTLSRRKSQRVINKELDSLALTSPDNCAGQPIPLEKEASRTSNSWLVWWKSPLTSDDYMKYLQSQDMDYLRVIYHLYNSESEDEEEARIALMKEKEIQKREQNNRIAEFRTKKQEFTPGMWNINSVMLGGLGKDPSFKEEQRLDMVIKYSFNEYQDLLPQ
ncbi:hypothetical protein GDO86_005616, partial [Hymenochirus boettgeri]